MGDGDTHHILVEKTLPDPNRYVKFAILSNHFENCKQSDCIICATYNEIYIELYHLFLLLIKQGKG